MTLPASQYDDVPYGDLAFFHTHPSHLAAVSALCGLPMPAIERCRVLELGCGTGFNLLAMSQSLPDATYVGFDASAVQIEHGRSVARAIGCQSVQLEVGRLEAIAGDLGSFDFIIAHGLYSWIPPDVQESLLGLIAKHLSPNGVAYLSYNTYPGWHLRAIFRDAMRLLAPREVEPRKRAHSAMELVRQLHANLPDAESPYALVLANEIREMQDQPDYYLTHEHLSEHNEPVSILDFASRLTAHGLDYLCESRFGTNTFTLSPGDREPFDLAGNDLIRREQLHDLRWNRYFRQSLVVHRGRNASRKPDPMAVQMLYLHPRVELSEPHSPIDDTESETVIREEDGEPIELADPVLRAVLHQWYDRGPGAMRVAQLLPVIQARFPDESRMGMAIPLLSAIALRGCALGYWHLYASNPPYSPDGGEAPRVCPLVRWQSQHTNEVTNRLHRTAKLTEQEREWIPRLDGTFTRDELAQSFQATRANVEEMVSALARKACLAD